MPEYAERPIRHIDMCHHYCRHLLAMTVEELHDKSDIAAELAWRDREIEKLREAIGKIADSDSEDERNMMIKSAQKLLEEGR